MCKVTLGTNEGYKTMGDLPGPMMFYAGERKVGNMLVVGAWGC
jgi:hypothetical protein